ncbi:MAG: 4-alpha-glucanotransferase [Oribacterium sp.]
MSEQNRKQNSSGAAWERAAGVLMPIFSLPGKYGIGTLGREARKFADFLAGAGQKYWQILPVGPTGYGDSPYQSFSTFAGNPYFIDLETLTEEGLLRAEECDSCNFGAEAQRISYGALYTERFSLLMRAYRRFQAAYDGVRGGTESLLEAGEEKNGTFLLTAAERRQYEDFLRDNGFWLPAYAEYRSRAMALPTEFFLFEQYEFRKQWSALKAYVNALGIEIIGDIPIYVSLDSSDVRTDPRLFQLDENGEPKQVAGCPPDAFSRTGQLWGNPLYDWDYHRKTGYEWWIRRMRHCFSLYDIVRVDHFRGFDEYYAVPYPSTDATGGHWEKGPGIELFRHLKRALGEGRRIIAEDLGYVTDSVRKLVEESGYPGMKILEFAFDSREEADYRPVTWRENTVAYTGTHDNQTLRAWLLEISEEDRRMAAAALHCSAAEMLHSDYVTAFLRMTLKARSNTVIIPLQDYMGLGGEARINTPSTLGGNWTYRFRSDDFTAALQDRIAELTKESGRWREKS